MTEETLLIDPALLAWAGPVIGLLFSAATVLAVVRIIRGPSILDRMIGTDVLLATLLCGIGAVVAIDGRVDLLPVMLVIAALGFIGSVGVSRYVTRHAADDAQDDAALSAAGRLLNGTGGRSEVAGDELPAPGEARPRDARGRPVFDDEPALPAEAEAPAEGSDTGADCAGPEGAGEAPGASAPAGGQPDEVGPDAAGPDEVGPDAAGTGAAGPEGQRP
ncbi:MULTISPECIES: monovalent cation/H+ antiporter complex subunit F [Brevibacterium]|uniref:monovalent cation/H+ antiporter complex subunit F n=1 Tax=Brevibacterium TaxID=1696 RepID=UPI0019258554|nr:MULTISPECIES: monovalent cation/H+ antiporter complex subunit F [Brevibacterium]WAL39735.1 monovalent cation/H+ antiporter complex subunit F [Brevibacterium sp. BRM-1]